MGSIAWPSTLSPSGVDFQAVGWGTGQGQGDFFFHWLVTLHLTLPLTAQFEFTPALNLCQNLFSLKFQLCFMLAGPEILLCSEVSSLT